MDLFTLWIVCVVCSTVIGAVKGQPIAGFFVGLIFGPLGVLAALFSGGNRRPCAECGEKIMRVAKICPHCKTPVSKDQGNFLTKWR